MVWEAFKRAKANKGAAGVDGQTVEGFEAKLEDNLYKLWNRMASGSYFPPPVRMVPIPKADGSERMLGIPTVSDRIAQGVVKAVLEPVVEPRFHPDSYGYRPGRSPIQAVGVARKRCWRFDWVLDLDIRGFFDNLEHSLVLRAVRRFTTEKWILLYVERWLKAPGKREDGTLVERSKGTPQGGVISPLLANVFLHLAFDDWMRSAHPAVPFERFADDIVVHCRTKEEAGRLLEKIQKRLAACKLELHPEKTKVVYCKDDLRLGKGDHEKFDFLGYTFRPRRAMNRKGKFFVGFLPAASNKATKKIRNEMKSWRIHLRSDKELTDLARIYQSKIRGWIQYYGQFYKSALYSTFWTLNRCLVRWAARKYRRLRGHKRKAERWLGGVARREPGLFAHWKMLGLRHAAG